MKNKKQLSDVVVKKNDTNIVKSSTSLVETTISSNSHNSSITNNNETVEKQHRINFVLNNMRIQKMIKTKEFVKKWCVWTATSVKNNNEQIKNMNNENKLKNSEFQKANVFYSQLNKNNINNFKWQLKI